MTRTFKHSGKLGDLIYSLPSIRALGGGIVYLRPDASLSFSTEAAESAIPLLKDQPYIEDARIWHGEQVEHDLDQFRLLASANLNLAKAHLQLFELAESEVDQPWIERRILDLEQPRFEVLMARSIRRNHVEGFWETAYTSFGASAAFVGSVEEHADFYQRIGPIPLLYSANLLELASHIAMCELFLGNQSCPMAIAEGLKQNTIVEVDSEAPNCTFLRRNLISVRTPNDLWMIENGKELLGLDDREDPSWFMVPNPDLDEFATAGRRQAESIEELCIQLRARRSVKILARNPRHWTSVVSHLQEDRRIQDGTSVVTADPAKVRSLLHGQLYRITEAMASASDNAEVTSPITSWLISQGESPEIAQESPRLLEVEFSAEPIEPMIDEATAGQLGPANFLGCSVIILTYNSAATIEQCLRSVLDSLGDYDELIVVDNASSDGTQGLVQGALAERSDCQFIRNSMNLGFSVGCNIGMRASKGRVLILLNPDTVVYGDWLRRFDRKFADPFVAAVGPISNCVLEAQFIGKYVPKSQLDQMSAEQIDQHLYETFGDRSTESKLLIGFCMALRRSVLDRIGLLDEKLFLGSEDLEMSLRLRSHGYRLRIAKGIFVYHIGGQSFKSESSDQVEIWLHESSSILRSKVECAFGRHMPTSLELWDSPIFSHIIG